MSFVLGLTGTIGAGKSTTAALFRAAGVPVFDADAAVHALYAGTGEAGREMVAAVAAAFPGAVREGAVDRAALGGLVMGDSEAARAALKRLEALVHPRVRALEHAFAADAKTARARLIVLDVPLLFETGGERRCDAVLVVTAAPQILRARVLARPGMSEEKLDAILARQMPDAEKRRRAHFILDTGRGLEAARSRVGAMLRALAGRPGGRAVSG